MSEKEGMFVAFLAYIADDGVILRDNSYPEQGKEKLQSRFAGRSDTSFVLTWEPLFEKIAESGEIGYTYGTHTNLDKATGTVTKGTYVITASTAVGYGIYDRSPLWPSTLPKFS